MMAEELVNYRYAEPSTLIDSGPEKNLRLSSFQEEVEESDLAPIFFMGRIRKPSLAARALTALSAVAEAKYSPPFAYAGLYQDPIINVGSNLLRFEAFSGCAGVYAGFDLLPDGLDGTFLAEGSTNVDFNRPMLTALGGVGASEAMSLSVGPGDLAVAFESGTVVERQVPLPERWLKSLGVVPVYLAGSELLGEMSGPQAAKMCRGLPLTKTRGDQYLVRRGRELSLSPLPTRGAEVAVGGLNRLHLAAPLLAQAKAVRVFAHPSGAAVTWRLYLDGLRFSLTLSRDSGRGFSGEGAGLNTLLETLPESLTDLNKTGPNQLYGDTSQAAVDNNAPALAAIGLLGYDLDEGSYFHRRLPFKPGRLLALNPRLKNALKLLTEGKVTISFRNDGSVEGRVEGSGVRHSVLLNSESERCTCLWTSKHGNTRGPCKHILAVKKAAAEAAKVESGQVKH